MPPWINYRKWKRILFLIFFITAMFGMGLVETLHPDRDGTAVAAPLPAAGSERASNTPQYVTVRIENQDDAFISGGEGVFTVEVILSQADEVENKSYQWDVHAPPPVLWISAPADSGLYFTGRNPTQSDQRALITLDPATVRPLKYSAEISYFIEPRAKATRHDLLFNVVANVVAPNGDRIKDIGEVPVPIEIDTTLGTKVLVLVIIAIVVFLFIVEWVRVDVVAIIIMTVLPLVGLLDSSLTFRGLSSNAVVAIIGVMIISFALNRSELVGRMLQPVLRIMSNSANRMMIVFSGLIAVISSVMQNTGAAVLFLPAIRHTSTHIIRTPLSRVLMPIGMSAILGGTLTMIGTSPLILLNDLLPPYMKKFGFLDLTPIGGALVIGGIAYFTLAAKYLLPEDGTPDGDAPQDLETADACRLCEYSGIQGPFELFVPENYQNPGGVGTIAGIQSKFQVNIVAIASKGGVEDAAPAPGTTVQPGHGLCVFGRREDIDRFVLAYGLDMHPEPVLLKNYVNPEVSGTAEIVISPHSTHLGKSISDIRFRETFGIAALALYKKKKTLHRDFMDIPLQAGDAILFYGLWEKFHAIARYHRNFIFTTPLPVDFKKPQKAGVALAVFLATLVLMMVSSLYFQNKPYNPMPLSVCLMAGALGMILTGVMTISEAYRAVDWRTIFLLGGLLPLGLAVDQTGTAGWAAKGIVDLLGDRMTPLIVMIVLAALSGVFTMVISNVGACTLLIPLGISIAHQMGMDPRLAVIIVGLGVSNSFMLPTHQVNALYMGPGGYRTLDYIKVGGILSLIYIVILVTMTHFFYS